TLAAELSAEEVQQESSFVLGDATKPPPPFRSSARNTVSFAASSRAATYGRRRASAARRDEYFSTAPARRRGSANSASAAQKVLRAASSASVRGRARPAIFSGIAGPSPQSLRAVSTSPSRRQKAAAARASVGFFSARPRKISARVEGSSSQTGMSNGASRRTDTRRASAESSVPSAVSRSP